MNRALVLPLALATAVALAGSVAAAPVSCRLVVDQSGDDRLYDQSVPPPADTVTRDGDLDVLSGDYATDAKNLTVVLRTRTLSGPEAMRGRMWVGFFTAAEQGYEVAAAVGPDGGLDGIVYRIEGEYHQGDEPAGAFTGSGIGRVKVTLDLARREVVMTAPLSHFAPYTPLTKGRVLTTLDMWTFRFTGNGHQRVELPNSFVADVGHGGVGQSVDYAMSKKSYTVGTKSCVTSGR